MNSNINNTTTTQNNLDFNPAIVEDWQGGYKLELDITAREAVKNWSVDFSLPFNIIKVYGVDLENHGDGSYTITGQNDQVSLNSGQSISPIFIIEDNGQQAVTPNFPSTETVTQPLDNSDNSQSNTIDIPESNGQSVGQSGKFNYGEALQKNFLFFEANESGHLSRGNRVAWRNDSTTNDGSTVGRDLEGGYFDAGDHVKFGQPMAASISMLALGGIEYRAAYQRAGQYDDLLGAVKHATDYFLKAHETSNGQTSRFYVQVGEGGSANDHGYWGAPETVETHTTRNAFAIEPNRPGSDVAASTASALAASSELFRGVNEQYADELLKNAEQLFEFADTYRGKYSDSIPQANPFYTSASGYADELAEGAVWLYKATGKQQYLDRAEQIFDNEVGYPSDWTWMTDNKSNSAVLLLAQESENPKYKQMTEQWLDSWVNGTGNVQYTPGGMAFRNYWGSLPLSAATAFLAELYHDTVKADAKYSNFANNQIDYILGDNPRNFSYMVGFGDNYAQRAHHRGAIGNSYPWLTNSPSNEHILYGALVGGPASADDFDYKDDLDDWITNEVGTVYNAPLTSALIQQYENFGGDPLTEAQLDDLIEVDANGVGF